MKSPDFTQNDGYVLSELKVNGSAVPATNPYTITDVTSDCTISATFEVDPMALIPVGAYIKYTPGTNITTSYTGGTYTKNSSYASGWKVFKNNNGQLDIISAESVGSLTLSGKDGYANAVYILNTISEGYVNSAYATDGRSLGSTADWTETTVNSSKSLGKITSTIKYGVSGFPYNDQLYTSDETIINTAVNGAYPLRPTSGYVWMASRYLITESHYSAFIVRGLNAGGYAYDGYLYYAYYGGATSTNSRSYGVRPIINLKSGLKIESGDGLTAETGYVLSN